jgi:hypothetical protein
MMSHANDGIPASVALVPEAYDSKRLEKSRDIWRFGGITSQSDDRYRWLGSDWTLTLCLIPKRDGNFPSLGYIKRVLSSISLSQVSAGLYTQNSLDLSPIYQSFEMEFFTCSAHPSRPEMLVLTPKSLDAPPGPRSSISRENGPVSLERGAVASVFSATIYILDFGIFDPSPYYDLEIEDGKRVVIEKEAWALIQSGVLYFEAGIEVGIKPLLIPVQDHFWAQLLVDQM